MRRSTSIRLIAGGAAVSGLLGTGLLAATSDSVSSTGNTVTSAVYTGPQPAVHNVQVGRVALNAADCNDAVYSDAPTTFVTHTTVDADAPLGSGGQGADDLCIKNVGNTIGRLVFTVGNVIDTEVGVCEAGEADVDGGNDTTCADGAAGELSSVIGTTHGNFKPGSAASCQGNTHTAFNNLRTTGLVMAATFSPGELCRIGSLSTFLASSLSEEQKKLTQTDRVQFDAVFTLRD